MMFVIKSAVIVAVTAVAIQIWPVLFGPKLKYEFDGNCEPGFENLKEVFKQNFAKGWDFEGAAFAVCHNGKLVADIWGGYADSEAHRIWQKDTMTTIFSTSKAVAALCLAMLVDRGLVQYDDLVTKYWPEFGQNGKEKVTIRMLASHQAGLAVLDEPITFDLVRDWRKMSAALEKQKPNWEIGTGAGYHAYTHGWIIDQVLRRVDIEKRSLGQFFREEVAIPYNLDIHIGLPLELEYRVARLKQGQILQEFLANLPDTTLIQTMYYMSRQPADSLLNRCVFKNPNWLSNENFQFNNPELHALEMGAVNVISTARSLAELFCLVDSGKIINKTVLDQLMKPVITTTPDLVIGMNVSWGYGFIHSKNPDGQFQIGHPGFGGQLVKYDPQHHLSIAYVRNGILHDDNVKSFKALEAATYDIIRNKYN